MVGVWGRGRGECRGYGWRSRGDNWSEDRSKNMDRMSYTFRLCFVLKFLCMYYKLVSQGSLWKKARTDRQKKGGGEQKVDWGLQVVLEEGISGRSIWGLSEEGILGGEKIAEGEMVNLTLLIKFVGCRFLCLQIRSWFDLTEFILWEFTNDHVFPPYKSTTVLLVKASWGKEGGGGAVKARVMCWNKCSLNTSLINDECTSRRYTVSPLFVSARRRRHFVSESSPSAKPMISQRNTGR